MEKTKTELVTLTIEQIKVACSTYVNSYYHGAVVTNCAIHGPESLTASVLIEYPIVKGLGSIM